MWSTVLVSFLTFFLIEAAPVEDYVQIHTEEAPSLTAAEELAHEAESGGYIVGDTELDLNRNAITDKQLRWPGGVVYYTILDDFTPAIKSTIETAMREIESDVNGPSAKCVQFKPRTNERNYVEIGKGKGCHSVVGNIRQGKQELSLGEGCEVKGIVMHELLHSLGFYHEQNRYDRDLFVNVNLNNVPDNKKPDFRKMSTSQLDTLEQSYSFDSIMHYGPYTLAADKSKPVLTPKDGKFIGQKMGQRLALVATDVIKIQKLYNCAEDTSHISNEQKNIATECNFESDLCTMSEGNGDFKWSVTKGVSGAGPVAGNTNGADGYVVATAAGHSGKVARFKTPLTSSGAVCLDFFLFQKGPSSYLSLVATGPRIQTQTFASYQGKYKNYWYNYRISLNVPAGISFQVMFVANMNSGDVAVDDVMVYSGKCR